MVISLGFQRNIRWRTSYRTDVADVKKRLTRAIRGGTGLVVTAWRDWPLE